MVGTICFAVCETEGQRQRVETVSMYLLGACIGGMLVGVALGAVSNEVLRPDLTSSLAGSAVVSAVGVLAISRHVGLVSFPLLSWPRQVPRYWWGMYDRRLVTLTWGALLGTGIATPQYFACFYLVLGLVVWFQDPLAGGLLVASFGLARAAGPVLALAVLGDRPHEFLPLAGRYQRHLMLASLLLAMGIASGVVIVQFGGPV